MSEFKKAVLRVVKKIPQGKVMSYGQVALAVGLPRAARQVGWIMNASGDLPGVPWWRVVNNQGRISIKGSKYSANEQRELLINEGIAVDKDLTFDISKFRYIPENNALSQNELDPFYLTKISAKVGYNK